MALSFDLEASKRFLEALENMRRPQGEGLRSDVRGEVPQALADEFRALMEESAPRPDAVQGAAEPGRVSVAAAPEGVRPVEGASPANEPARVGGVRDDLAADAGERLGASGPEPLMTPENLLSLQFETNMHMFEFKSFDAIRQSALREMESALRQTT